MERHTYVYTPPCSLMSGRRMPLYMQRQLCRYTCSGIRAAMHEAATVPLYTQRQLPPHTNGRTAANTPFSTKRDCSAQARWQAIPQETSTRRASRSTYQTVIYHVELIKLNQRDSQGDSMSDNRGFMPWTGAIHERLQNTRQNQGSSRRPLDVPNAVAGLFAVQIEPGP